MQQSLNEESVKYNFDSHVLWMEIFILIGVGRDTKS